MPHCPSCGSEVSTKQNFCRDCGEDISDISGNSAPHSTSTDAGSSASDTNLTNNIATDRVGDWVVKKRVEKVRDLLDNDEKVHYMWKGGTIDVEGSSAGDSIFGNDRDRKSSFKGIFTAVTSKRIVIAIPQFLGDDERHIPYHSATSVDLDTGLMSRRVSIQTKGQTYHIQAQGPSKDELRGAMRFIREKIEEVNTPQQIQSESAPDPTEQLKNLKELHEEGILSEDEFEEKKQTLLDKI